MSFVFVVWSQDKGTLSRRHIYHYANNEDVPEFIIYIYLHHETVCCFLLKHFMEEYTCSVQTLIKCMQEKRDRENLRNQ